MGYPVVYSEYEATARLRRAQQCLRKPRHPKSCGFGVVWGTDTSVIAGP